MSTHYGLTMNVYRCANGMDATANGITSHHAQLTIIGTIDEFGTFTTSPERSRLHPATDTAPAVALRRNRSTPTAHLVPVTADGEPIGGRWYMAGGNYATGDSRIADYYAQIGLEPIYGATPVHDRTEG